MRIFRSIEEFASKGPGKSVITQGTFDGVHLGHRKILERMREMADKQHAQSVLLTFDPHPRIVLYGKKEDLHLLSTLEEKEEMLKQAGLQNLIIHKFTKELAQLSPSEFVNSILVEKLHAHTIVTGHDHRFGKNREGSAEDLKYWGRLLGFGIEEIEPFMLEGITISSTKIRQAIAAGNVDVANTFLGYNYSLTAKVIEGKKLGAKLGYPTANLEVPSHNGSYDYKKLIPADGIYAVYVGYEGKSYKGMLNIGMNPTIEGKGRSIEVHIFDFNENIYNKTIGVEFIKRTRDEAKFSSLEELKAALDIDKRTVLGILS